MPLFSTLSNFYCIEWSWRVYGNYRVKTCFRYLKCESVPYWYIVVISQNQLTIFIPASSTITADYSGINYLLRSLVFLAKIKIVSIKIKYVCRFFSFKASHEDTWSDYSFDILTLNSIGLASTPLILFIYHNQNS